MTPLAKTIRSGSQVEALHRQPLADAAEAVDDRVGDRQNAVRTAQLHDALQVAVGRDQDAARADDRLEHERGDVLGVDALQLGGQGVDRVPGDARRLLHQRAELLAVRHAEDARADAVRAVVAVVAADQVAPLGLAAHVVVEAGELRRGVDRVAAAAREEDLRARLRRHRRRSARPSRRAGPFARSPNTWNVSSSAIWRATASAISRRPWPTFAYQRLEAPSR